ncbi:MAG: glutamate racemase [Oscillospiraceae bacterium]
MNNDAIGVFDSGLGGLTAVKEFNRILPNENIIYFGDTARIPYGSRSRNTIIKYASQDIAFLQQYNIKMIVAACGTVSSMLGDITDVDGVPYTGVLMPTCRKACELTQNGRIGVIGTPATIKSGSYSKIIKSINPSVEVYPNACPLFVHLVENGYTDRYNKITILAAEEYLEPIRKHNVDTLIMGCTHYPIIKDIIHDIMGDGVKLISAGGEAANYTKNYLEQNDMLSDNKEKGSNRFYVSDSVEMFMESAEIFLGHTVDGEVFRGDVHHIGK